MRHAVVVRVRKEMERSDGSFIKFEDNACVLVNKSGDPIGTRMNGELCENYRRHCLNTLLTDVFSTGVVASELRGKQWSKILSLAPMHV